MSTARNALCGLLLCQVAFSPAITGTLNAQTYEPYFFSTYAGGAPCGSSDGTGVAAAFCSPNGLALNSSGDLLVADTANQTIRKVTATGVVSTIAGSAGFSGTSDGTGSNARFSVPIGVAIAPSGLIYVVDRFYALIRKIEPDGSVTTFAGNKFINADIDATGTEAAFIDPAGITLDPSGNLYVAEGTGNTIRKITPDGVVTSVAGAPRAYGSNDGPGSAARFANPIGITADSSGQLYVADQYNHTIRKIDSSGNVTTIAGSPGSFGTADGVGRSARFNHPSAIAVDAAGILYVTDEDNHTLRRIDGLGIVTTLAGTAGSAGSIDGTGSAARFNTPSGVFAGSDGFIYVGDRKNNAIRKVTPQGAVSTLAGSAGGYGTADGPARIARFDNPTSLAAEASGVLYVADERNNTIRKIATDGSVTTFVGNSAGFNEPSGVALDALKNLYVADSQNHVIRKVTPTGAVTTFAGTDGQYGSADGVGTGAMFDVPSDVAVDRSNNIFVADTGNQTIRKITAAGVVTTFAGLAGNGGTVDGIGAAARFESPIGVAIDPNGNIYVADSRHHVIRKVTPAAVVSTLAGAAGVAGMTDGSGDVARFNTPTRLAVDAQSNVFVADSGNNRIRKISPQGAVTTLAGSIGGNRDGAASVARFNEPHGITIDGSGRLYITDRQNEVIKTGSPAIAITSASNATFFVGHADSFMVTTGGSPTPSLSLSTVLPPGIAFSDNGNGTATISGTASAQTGGVYLLKVRAANGVSPDFTQDLILTINEAPTIVTADNVTFQVGRTGSFLVRTAHSYPIPTLSYAGALPYNVIFDDHQDGTATISGSPQASSAPRYSITIIASNGALPDARQPFTFDVSPTPSPGILGNISTRLQVGTGNNVLFAGFIIQGSAPKKVLIRSAGPSLTSFGVPGAMANPQLELHDANTTIGTNDNWQTTQIGGVITSDQVAEIQGSGAAPRDAAEPAIIATLGAGSYTAIVKGVGSTQGVATVELYDLTPNNGSTLANISTRGFIQTGDNVMIGGFIVVGQPSRLVVRATGPSLAPFGITNALANPRLELHDSNGANIGNNDDWQTSQIGGVITSDQSAAIQSSGLAPSNAVESAIIATLPAGSYTAISQGVNGGTGVGLVEVYTLP